jgi:cyclic pyranopterin phosphate synthase
LERKRSPEFLRRRLSFLVRSQLNSPMDVLTDKFGRAITDLRISITDRCNYKCVYCRTGNEGAIYGDLPFPDYLRMAGVLVGMGIRKVRITGGEPLLRKGVVGFVRDLAKLQTIDREPLDIALTTNGHMLAEMAQPLKAAGLRRVTVSMDAVDPERFRPHHSRAQRIRSSLGRNPRRARQGTLAGQSELCLDARLQ